MTKCTIRLIEILTLRIALLRSVPVRFVRNQPVRGSEDCMYHQTISMVKKKLDILTCVCQQEFHFLDNQPPGCIVRPTRGNLDPMYLPNENVIMLLRSTATARTLD